MYIKRARARVISVAISLFICRTLQKPCRSCGVLFTNLVLFFSCVFFFFFNSIPALVYASDKLAAKIFYIRIASPMRYNTTRGKPSISSKGGGGGVQTGDMSLPSVHCRLFTTSVIIVRDPISPVYSTQATRNLWWSKLTEESQEEIRKEPPTTNVQVFYQDLNTGIEYVSTTFLIIMYCFLR